MARTLDCATYIPTQRVMYPGTELKSLAVSEVGLSTCRLLDSHRIDSLRLADKLGGSVEDDHRAKSIGLEPTTYGVSRFGCYQLTYLETLVAVLLGH